MGSSISKRKHKERRHSQDTLRQSNESLFRYVTTVQENRGSISVGNVYHNYFNDCQNVKVQLHPIEREVSCNRKTRTQTFSEAILGLRESLAMLYRGEESWLDPLPWISANKFQTEDYFIHSDIEELDRRGEKVVRQNVSMDCILEPTENSNTVAPRRILLQAEAGFGKTSTCTKIAFDWATKVETKFKRFDLVIYVRLRNLVGDLEDYVCKLAMATSKEEISKEEMSNLLSKLEGNLLLLLDGLDECSEENLKLVNRVVGFDHSNPNQSCLRGATIVMTTRPTLVKKMTIYSDRHIRIRSMSVEERNKFIRNFFDSPKVAERVVDVLSRQNFQWEMSPLMLFLICYLVDDKGELSALQSESEIFNRILKLLAERYVDNEKLPWSGQDIEVRLAQVGELCLEMLKKKTMLFRTDEVNEFCACPQSFVFGFGVFMKTLSIGHHSSDTYEPVHKRFVEHLAALYIQRLCNQIQDPVKKLACLKSFVQRPTTNRFRKVVVFEVERHNKICFQGSICQGVLDAYITVSPAKGKGTKNVSVEVVLYSESVVRLSNWRCFPSQLYLQANVVLDVQGEDKPEKLKCIPKRYREGVGFFLDDHQMVCELMVHRKCACTTDTKIFSRETTRVMQQLISFYYNEKDVSCQACTFSKKPEVLEMILTGETLATSFKLTRIPSQIKDSQAFLMKVCSDSKLNDQNTVSADYAGNLEGICSVLVYGLIVSGMPSTSFGSFQFQSVGKFLEWVLNSFGFTEQTLDSFLPLPNKQQRLAITYGNSSYVFVKDLAGAKLSISGEDEPKNLSHSFLKRLIHTLHSEKTQPDQLVFKLTLFTNDKKLSCAIVAGATKCTTKCNCCDYFVWHNSKL